MSGGVSNLRPVPFEPGHDRSVTHGFYRRVLSVSEADEVTELADTIRALSPLAEEWGAKIEPLVALAAGQFWRLQRGYADLVEHGQTRGKTQRVAPIVPRLEALERQLLATLDRLALTPQAAASLGLTIARVREMESGRGVDLDKLEPKERVELGRLLEKARGS